MPLQITIVLSLLCEITETDLHNENEQTESEVLFIVSLV